MNVYIMVNDSTQWVQVLFQTMMTGIGGSDVYISQDNLHTRTQFCMT